MAEILWFLRQGWKNTWKQNLVWLFSTFPILISLFPLVQIKYGSNPGLLLLYLAGFFLSIFLAAQSYIGVPYLVYCFTMNSPTTLEDAFHAVGKFFGRILGCYLIGILVLLPCIFLMVGLSLDNSTRPPHLSNRISLLRLPLSLFIAMVDFAMFEFFKKDSGIRATLSNSWNLFTSHFGVLAALGIILTVVFGIFSTASGILTVLLKSSFDLAALSQLNYLNPSTSFTGDVLFILTNGIGQMVCTVFSTSVFALAYLKYSEKK